MLLLHYLNLHVAESLNLLAEAPSFKAWKTASRYFIYGGIRFHRSPWSTRGQFRVTWSWKTQRKPAWENKEHVNLNTARATHKKVPYIDFRVTLNFTIKIFRVKLYLNVHVFGVAGCFWVEVSEIFFSSFFFNITPRPHVWWHKPGLTVSLHW